MGQLTTHVLDTAHGVPAASVAIRLYRIEDERTLCTNAQTNADGRTDAPLLPSLETGFYELEFDIGAYFAAREVRVPQPPFLDTIVIRVSLRSDANYHVPLLVSPWGYSTYRGS